MAVELATAYISLIPSMKGAKGAITADLAGVDSKGIGHEMGSKMGGGLSGALKGIAGPAIVALGAIGFAGFIKDAAAASDATDKFKATMSFAGMDTTAITAAAKAAKDYADQTVYDLPTIQNMTAQLASNGVKDYTGLTQAAGNLNAVAGGSAETFKSVAMVMTQTAGAGKLTTENWNQMADAIPGAAGPLMRSLEEAGAYTGNFRDAMAAGQITSDEFNASLMKLGMDPIAVEAARSTKTFEGAIGNLQATINSGLMGALDALKPAITGTLNVFSSGLGHVFGALGAVFELLKTGDFTGGIGKALGIEEDSPVVGVLLGIRSGLSETAGGVRAFFAAFKAGGDDVASSGFAGFLEGLGLKARSLFDGLMSTIGPLIPQIISMWSAFSPLQIIFAAIGPLLPQIAEMFGQLASTLGGTLSTVLTSIIPMVMQLSAVISQSLGQVLAAVLPTIVQLITMLGATFTQLLPIIMPIIATIIQLAMTLISQLMPIITQLVSTVMPMVVTIFGAVLQAIGPLISMIAGLLIPIIMALMPVVVTIFGVIANVITTVMQIIMGVIQVVTGIISGNWGMVWDGILNIFSGIWNTIVAVLTGVMAVIWAVISAGFNLVVGFISGILGNIGQFFADTWNNITNGISAFVGGVGQFFAGIPDAIMGALSGAGTWLFDAGKNIVQGLFDGIKSLAGTIGNFFLSLLPGWIVEPFKIALNINSPSRVFRGFGRNIGEGIILGADDMKSDIKSTMTGLVAVPDVPSFATSATARASMRGASGVTNNFTINQVDDTIGTAHAIARRQNALAV